MTPLQEKGEGKFKEHAVSSWRPLHLSNEGGDAINLRMLIGQKPCGLPQTFPGLGEGACDPPVHQRLLLTSLHRWSGKRGFVLHTGKMLDEEGGMNGGRPVGGVFK